MSRFIHLSILITFTLHNVTYASGRGQKPTLSKSMSFENETYGPAAFIAKRPKKDPSSTSTPASPPAQEDLDNDEDETQKCIRPTASQDNATPECDEDDTDESPTTVAEFIGAFIKAATEDDQLAFMEHVLNYAFMSNDMISSEAAEELSENLEDLVEIYQSDISNAMRDLLLLHSANPNLTNRDIRPLIQHIVVFLKDKHMTDEGTMPLETAADYRQLLIKAARQSDAAFVLLNAFIYKNKFISPIRKDIYRLIISSDSLAKPPYLARIHHFIQQVSQTPSLLEGSDDRLFNQLILRLTQSLETQLMLQGHILCLTGEDFLRSYGMMNKQWNLSQFIRLSIHHNIYNESKRKPKNESAYKKHKEKFLQDALAYERSLSGDAHTVYRKTLQDIFRHGHTTDHIPTINEQLNKLSSKLVSDMIVWNAQSR